MAHPVSVPQWQLDPDYQEAEVLVCKFIQSFILAISVAPLQVHYYSEALPTAARIAYCIGVSRRSAQATVSKGLALGPYVAARAGVEPTTLRLRVIDLTNEPLRPTMTYEKEL